MCLVPRNHPTSRPIRRLHPLTRFHQWIISRRSAQPVNLQMFFVPQPDGADATAANYLKTTEATKAIFKTPLLYSSLFNRAKRMG